MKLSTSPPPPSPEPNDPNPVASELAPVSPSELAAEPVATTPPRRPLAWPGWFAGLDFTLATLAVLLAFLLASFVARNSDLWLHLAAGERLLAGEYRLGTDPFSYSAADRTWVNPSWLFDVLAALLYRDTGAVLVGVKAAVVTLTFGLLLILRRSGQPLLPWAATTAVAVLAAAPYLQLRPTVVSLLFLAVTLVLLFRLPQRPGSWRLPAAVAVTLALWSNLDQWFILGPFTVALVLAGECLHRLTRGRAGESAATDPGSPASRDDPAAAALLAVPDLGSLAKALLLGGLACMVNPHHVGVWQLPFELVGDPAANLDPRLRLVVTTPLSRLYTDNAGLGYNLNGLAYAVLFVGGGAILGLAGSRLRGGILALWVGFAVLSLTSIAAIPFLAVVAVPVIAAPLNALSAGLTLRTWGDPKTRVLLLGSALVRVGLLLALLLAVVCTWPGWLHPPTGNEAYARRVGWGVEPDAAMVQAARQLQEWRADGRLPPDARGFITSVELANHCAYFAPREKVYVNGRLNFHRPELATYVAVRAGMGLVPVEEAPDPAELPRILARLGVEYTAIHGGPGDSARMRELARNSAFVQWNDPAHWSPWYLNGRTTICGWRAGPGADRPSFDRLRLDPVRLAFGPQVVPLPASSVRPVPPQGGWEVAFLRGATISPAAADEAIGWSNFKAVYQAGRQQKQYAVELALFLLDRTVGGRGLLLVGLRNRTLVPADESMVAVPFLALRAARRAIADDPDHPDSYYALAVALEDPDLPLSDDERAVARATALRQCLARLPPPDRFRPGVISASPTEVATRLAELYLNRKPELGQAFLGMPVNLPALQVLSLPSEAGYLPATGFVIDPGGGRLQRAWAAIAPPHTRVAGPYLLPLDLAREALQLAEKYAQVELREDRLKAFLEAVRAELKRVEGELVRASTAYEQVKLARGGQMKLRDQVEAALRNNLVGEALERMLDRQVDFAQEFGSNTVPAALCRIALLMAVGRLEDAAADLDALTADPDFQKQMVNDLVRFQVRMLAYQRHLLEGNYPEAGAILDEVALSGIPTEDPPPTPEQARLKNTRALAEWLRFLPGAESSPWPLEVIAREQLLSTVLMPFMERQQVLARRRAAEAEFYARRGLLLLFEGNIAEAEKRLLRTRQPGVPDWGVPDQRNPTAERFLNLIAEARRRAAD